MTTKNLYTQLKQAKSEEDIKDAYIKALGLKSFTKGIVDIRTKEIWFEAKDGRHTLFSMFTQLLNYVHDARTKGEEIPPLLAVIDSEKAAIMKTADVLPFLDKKTIKWGKSASNVTPEALAEVSAHIGTYFVKFNIATQENEFISTVKEAIKTGEIIRTQITPDNLRQVFDKWCELIGSEIANVNPEDYALLFFADIMHDGKTKTHENLPAKLVHVDDAPAFSLNGTLYELGNQDGYHEFWTIYHKPPNAEYRDYLLARRDSLIPLDTRCFKGAFYTPLIVVEKAYDKLTETLGKGWQKNYIVWDMCCGVGNLETKHGNHKNLFMSTLDKADIDVMKATKTCPAAHRFQYDYLNDDITDDGKIDYTLTNKVPKELQQAIAEGKKILVLINPPYAEATNADNVSIGAGAENKTGVAKTKFAKNAMTDYGKASNELFTQFVARIAQEMPTATLAMFSKLKYVNAPNFEKFRQVWNAKYLGGFIVHSKAFDGLAGNFPIGFLVWSINQNAKKKTPILEISAEVLDKKAQLIGDKSFYNLPNKTFLNVWLERPKANKTTVIPLKNAISPTTGKAWISTWSDDAIAYMYCGVNDIQHANQQTVLFSSVYSGGHGFYITPENLWQAAVIFSVRRLIKPTWQNDRDQFLQPTAPLSDEFKNDCLIWMLFNGSNLTASADGLEWNGETWSIVNHFIPFNQTDVGAADPFESDFMAKYLEKRKKSTSTEAKAVLNAGNVLWSAYFAKKRLVKASTKDDYKLNRLDVGWYQIRNALKSLNDTPNAVSFDNFEKAYKALSEKLQPQVYELGFLRDSEKTIETDLRATLVLKDMETN
ncbi:MAG: hypothetical protein WCJ11_03740 [Methylococcaceae bacterium]